MPERPLSVKAAVYLLSSECLVFAVLITVFVYRTLNRVPGYTVYYGDTLSKRSAALTEALVIGAFLVIAIVLVVVMVPGLMRGEAWARICLVAVAGGLVVYPLILTVRALFDPLYVDGAKILFTVLGSCGAVTAIGLLLSPSANAFFRR